MNENEKWLENRLKDKPLLEENERWLIDRLLEKDVSDADREGCIDTLEMLLSLDALPNLVLVLKDEANSYRLREQAAKAIAAIDSSYVQTELDTLRLSASPSLKHLLDLAQAKIAP